MREVGLPDGRILVHGHWGRPALVFPSEQGNAADAESNGLVGAVAGRLEAGRVKLYCVESYDAASWSAGHLPLEERAGRTSVTSHGSSTRASGSLWTIAAAGPGRC